MSAPVPLPKNPFNPTPNVNANISSISPLDNIMGPARVLLDQIRTAEAQGQIVGLSRYLQDAIIVVRNIQYPMLIEVFIPQFLFYFQFVISQDEKTKQIYIEDINVVYPVAQPPYQSLEGKSSENNEDFDEDE